MRSMPTISRNRCQRCKQSIEHAGHRSPGHTHRSRKYSGGSSMSAERQTPANPRATMFVGSKTGSMRVVSHTTICGQPIERAEGVDMIVGVAAMVHDDAVWAFHGVATNDRYTTRAEKTELTSKQAPIGRAEATSSALILLRKRAEWWALTQDERRAILEEDSAPHRDWHALSSGRRPALASLSGSRTNRRHSTLSDISISPQRTKPLSRDVVPVASDHGMVVHGSRDRHSPSQGRSMSKRAGSIGSEVLTPSIYRGAFQHLLMQSRSYFWRTVSACWRLWKPMGGKYGSLCD